MSTNYIPRRRRLGEILVHKGKLTPDQVTDFLQIQKENAKPLGQILIEHGIISNDELTKILAEQLGIPHMWLRKGLIDPRIVNVLPKKRPYIIKLFPCLS